MNVAGSFAMFNEFADVAGANGVVAPVPADHGAVEGVGGRLGDGQSLSLADGSAARAGRRRDVDHGSFFVVALLVLVVVVVVVGLVNQGGVDRRRSWFLRRLLAVVVGVISAAGFNALFPLRRLGPFFRVKKFPLHFVGLSNGDRFGKLATGGAGLAFGWRHSDRGGRVTLAGGDRGG